MAKGSFHKIAFINLRRLGSAQKNFFCSFDYLYDRIPQTRFGSVLSMRDECGRGSRAAQRCLCLVSCLTWGDDAAWPLR